jgi:hypothetical protein
MTVYVPNCMYAILVHVQQLIIVYNGKSTIRLESNEKIKKIGYRSSYTYDKNNWSLQSYDT